jgi:enoyl-CoA hydratase
MDAAQASARRAKGFAAYDALEAIPKAVVAVVDGPAVGSGCEIAMSCDIVLGTAHASFRYPEVVWGTVGATQRLPRIVGKHKAKELLFTGRRVEADEAFRLQLITRLIDREILDAEVAAVMRDLAERSPDAIRLTKRCIDQGMESDRRGALAIEMLAIEEMLARDDWKQGIADFSTRGGR